MAKLTIDSLSYDLMKLLDPSFVEKIKSIQGNPNEKMTYDMKTHLLNTVVEVIKNKFNIIFFKDSIVKDIKVYAPGDGLSFWKSYTSYKKYRKMQKTMAGKYDPTTVFEENNFHPALEIIYVDGSKSCINNSDFIRDFSLFRISYKYKIEI